MAGIPLSILGACSTELLRNYPGRIGQALRVIGRILFRPPEDGAQSIIYCVVSDRPKNSSGKYFADCNVRMSYLIC